MTVTTRSRGQDAADSLSDQSLLLPGQWNGPQASAGDFLLPVGTDWVERDVLEIGMEVAERFPNLRVASCECGRCVEEGHFPHAVLELCKDGVTRPVFGFREFGRHIIDRLMEIHLSNDPERKLEEANRKARAEVKRQVDEQRREGLEVVRSALESHKVNWTGPHDMKTDPNARITR